MPVFCVGFRGFDTHRAVQENGPVAEAPFVEILCHEVQEILGTAYCKCRYQDVSLVGAGDFENATQLFHGFSKRPM